MCNAHIYLNKSKPSEAIITLSHMYGVKTVSNPPTNAREIHTCAHNPQMHVKDSQGDTQIN